MSKDNFQPIRTAEIVGHAFQKNDRGEYLLADLGPAITIESLMTRPERPYLVEGVLTQGSLALLSAESFVGKTFFGMELARAVSTGAPFLGRYPVSRGGVLYIAQDGSDEEYIRQWKKLAKSHWEDYLAYPDLQAWEAFLAGEEVDVSGLSPLPVHPFNDRVRFEFNRALGIDVTDDLTKILLTALRMEHSLGDVWVQPDPKEHPHVDPDATEKGAKLIVFDAGHSVFFGNENDSGEVQNVMTNLRQLAIATGATVLLIVHLNKYSPLQGKQGMPRVHENRVRGSGVFQSAPDWHMQLHRGKEDGEVYAYQLKDRAGNRCKSLIYKMVFDEQRQQMTLGHVRDMTETEHRSRKVTPTLIVLEDPKKAVLSEFDKGREMSRDDVVNVLKPMARYIDKADSTVEDAAKRLLSTLQKEDLVEQTRAASKKGAALYRRKPSAGEASA